MSDKDRYWDCLDQAMEASHGGHTEDALAWLDCTVFERKVAGTHTLYIGEVQAASSPRSDCPPLVYWNHAAWSYYRQSEAEASEHPHARDVDIDGHVAWIGLAVAS